MTITPVPVLPATSGGRPKGDAPSGNPEDFAALVSAAAGRLGEQDCCADESAEATGTEEQAATPQLLAVPAGAVPVPGVPVGTSDPATAPGSAVTSSPAQPAASGLGTTPFTAATPVVTAPGDTRSALVTVAEPDTSPATEADARAVASGTAEATTGDLVSPPPTAAAGDPDAATVPADTRPRVASTDVPSPAPAGAVAPTAPSSPVTPAAASDASASTSAPSPTTVLEQVAPALSRVVSRGDGEHRMMLKLHPADLGEIHLTVTVRGDQVDVEIAASAEARELLRDGVSQLRALLDPTGRSGGQLVFRDLPVAQQQPVVPAAGAGSLLGSTTDGPGPDGRGGASYSGEGRDDRRETGGPGPAPDRGGPVPQTPTVHHRRPGGPALDVTI